MSGLHINALTNAHLGYIQQVRPGVNLLLSPKPEHVAAIKAASPNSLLIGRPYVKDSDLHARYLAGEQQARDAAKWAADICLPAAASMPQVDAWLILNEPPVDAVRQVELLAIFDSEFAHLMRAEKRRACIGAFARGTPQVPQLDGGAALNAYRPALWAARETGAWLAIHEYGPKQPLSFEAEWHALRWQRRILPWLEANGIPVPQYVITETGLDRGTGALPDGWRAMWELGGYGDDEQGRAAYTKDLLWLVGEYARDARCLGACIYCAGDNGDARWHSFRVDGPILNYLARAAWPRFGSASAPTPVPVPPVPIPAPQPTPTPAAPKEDNVNLPEWIKIEKAMGEPGQQVWRLVKAVYLPPEGEPNSQGRHHIEIMEPHDASKKVAIHNKQTGELWTLPLEKPVGEPAQNHPMYAEPNNYSAYMTGAPSDVVSGMVLPAKHHVVYQLWFELVKMPENVPTPTPTPGGPMPDRLVTILQRIMGNRFEDVRAKMPDGPGAPFGYADSTKMPFIALHYSASAAGPTTPFGIAKFHTDKPPTGRGWAGIGYHFVLDEGKAYYVGDINTQRAHVANRNDEALGICFTGTYNDSLPSAADINAAKLLIQGLDEFYGHKKRLMGHNQILPGHTLCPGRIVELIPTLRTVEPSKPTKPNYAKIVWHLEQAARNLQAEGLQVEHDYLVKTVLPPIVKLRDGK